METTSTEKNRRLRRKWKEEGKCPRCAGERDDQFITCSKCRAKTGQAIKRMEKKRTDAGLCRRCSQPVQDVGYKICTACSQNEYEKAKNRETTVACQKDWYRRIKDEAFQAYGGYVCSCCGENKPMFMCMDHINGGGELHRQNEVGRGRNIYSWLKKNNYPTGFQVLCQNCNIGKHMNGGICPHKTKCV